MLVNMEERINLIIIGLEDPKNLNISKELVRA
jgi:hypothetical protein